jgi:hypothetical protein
MEETKITKKKHRISMMKQVQYRNTVCLDCHYNRYNFQSEGDALNSPTTGEGCWHLKAIKRGVCPLWHKDY